MQEKLEYESLDELLAVLQDMHKDLGADLKLWKADIDSAFRRIPVLPAHRQFACVAFRHRDNVVTAQHLGMPFGSVASVHHWERIGELITAIARRVLHLPVLRQAFVMMYIMLVYDVWPAFATGLWMTFSLQIAVSVRRTPNGPLRVWCNASWEKQP